VADDLLAWGVSGDHARLRAELGLASGERAAG